MNTILLAAGFSTRMGQIKQTMALGGIPMARRVAEAFLPDNNMYVVIGAHGEAVKAVFEGLPCQFLVNPCPDEGMFSSAQIGCRAIPEGESALLCPCDCPGIASETVRNVAAQLEHTPDQIVIPSYYGQRGHPVGMPAWLVEHIRQLPPTTPGLRSLWPAFADRIVFVEVDDAAILHDFDTPEDVRGLFTPSAAT